MNYLSPKIQALLNIKAIQDFLTAARAFIDLAENTTIKQADFYPQMHKTLAKLYHTGLSFAPVSLTYTQPAFSLQQFFKKKQTPKNQNANLIANLGEACFYWEVFDPTYKDENEPTLGWLVDDLSDIYRDFKTEIHKIDHIASNEAIIDGLWSLKFGFTSHWGNHCINAIRALHYITYEGKT